jgi:hypothetical protein
MEYKLQSIIWKSLTAICIMEFYERGQSNGKIRQKVVSQIPEHNYFYYFALQRVFDNLNIIKKNSLGFTAL